MGLHRLPLLEAYEPEDQLGPSGDLLKVTLEDGKYLVVAYHPLPVEMINMRYWLHPPTLPRSLQLGFSPGRCQAYEVWAKTVHEVGDGPILFTFGRYTSQRPFGETLSPVVDIEIVPARSVRHLRRCAVEAVDYL